MLIGWDEMGDLRQYDNDKDAVNKALNEIYPDPNKPDGSFRKNDVSTLLYMSHDIQKGDIVYARSGLKEIIGRGIVTSDYRYDVKRTDYPNARDVEWTHFGHWPADRLSQPTIIPKDGQWVKEIEKAILMPKSDKSMRSQIDRYTELLKSKKNIILQGAPGTGKTYSTAAVALSILGQDDVDLADHKAVMERYEQLRKQGYIAFCTFHQSMEYEDFVEGLKPFPVKDANGNLVGMEYRVEDGIFKQICDAAMENLTQSMATGTELGNYGALFDNYCAHIEDELAELEEEGKDASIGLDPKSKMRIRRVWRSQSGAISSIIIAQDGHTSTQSLSKRIFLRDYASFLSGNIKSYKDIKPAYESQSSFHGNAIYYFPLYKEIKEFSKTKEGSIVTPKKVEERNYVLIIDEINRGNVAKIFGELITLLEADKRVGGDAPHPIKVKLPYSKNFDLEDSEDFGVPSNLYIIGTMNTTDRSTGSLDYALRRRFAFITLKSDKEVVEKHYDDLGDEELKNTAFSLFDDIYKFISNPKHCGGDMGIDDLMVGHSYFMARTKEELKNKMEYEILPLIAEYVNDGILRVREDERKKAFDCWGKLQPIATEKEPDEQEDSEQE